MIGNAHVSRRFSNLEKDGQCANYRPISFLPAVSKVFEKEVFRQVYGYLTENCMLSKFQSGFRPKHCTVTHSFKCVMNGLNTWIMGN